MNLLRTKFFFRLVAYFIAMVLVPIALFTIVSGLPILTMLPVGLLSLVLGLFLAVMFARDIIQPIQRLTVMMGRMTLL